MVNLIPFYLFTCKHLQYLPIFLQLNLRSFILLFMNFDTQTIWLEINLGAIRRNIQRIKALTKKPVMAVVKANGYGHGLVEVSKTAIKAGIEYLCVARIEEALRIRSAGITSRILVMGYTSPAQVSAAINNDLSLMVNTPELATEYNRNAASGKKPLNVHMKVDTGMGRLGVMPDDGVNFGKLIFSLGGLTFEGLFTHFASADEPEKPTTNEQIEKFNRVISGLGSEGIRPRVIHAANSAATLYFPDARYDAVRPGIAIYGLHPSAEAPVPSDFEPALTWKCRLASVKDFSAGSGIGYNHRYVTSRQERIGAASVGYADGLRRRLGNIALIGGKRVDQAGGMCMDQSMWKMGSDTTSKIGDEVVLIGSQEKETITAEELGDLWGTVNYDVVCGLTDRVPRYYIDA
jgi:alanine racemase